MRLLISDANILIDMEVGGLLQVTFQLQHQFGVPDVLFVEELANHHPKLPAMGLKVLPLQAAAVRDGVALLTRHGASGVSRNDMLSLALARQEGCRLLTGDRRLRNVAEAE